ncbi:hypothetical protein BH11PAT4_BH11PAT4_4820 [soil metagenome]
MVVTGLKTTNADGAIKAIIDQLRAGGDAEAAMHMHSDLAAIDREHSGLRRDMARARYLGTYVAETQLPGDMQKTFTVVMVTIHG